MEVEVHRPRLLRSSDPGERGVLDRRLIRLPVRGFPAPLPVLLPFSRRGRACRIPWDASNARRPRALPRVRSNARNSGSLADHCATAPAALAALVIGTAVAHVWLRGTACGLRPPRGGRRRSRRNGIPRARLAYPLTRACGLNDHGERFRRTGIVRTADARQDAVDWTRWAEAGKGNHRGRASRRCARSARGDGAAAAGSAAVSRLCRGAEVRFSWAGSRRRRAGSAGSSAGVSVPSPSRSGRRPISPRRSRSRRAIRDDRRRASTRARACSGRVPLRPSRRGSAPGSKSFTQRSVAARGRPRDR